MVVEMASYTVHCAYMSEVCYTRCINAVLLLRLWAYVALYVLCAALQDSAGEMYFYYSLFLTTACTMSAFVLHLCRYMHMVQIKQRHTHSSVSSLLQERKKSYKCKKQTTLVPTVFWHLQSLHWCYYLAR